MALSIRNGYSPVGSMGSRPHPMIEHASECIDDNHMAAMADAALMAAAVLFGAGCVFTVLLGLVCKWLVESLK